MTTKTRSPGFLLSAIMIGFVTLSTACTPALRNIAAANNDEATRFAACLQAAGINAWVSAEEHLTGVVVMPDPSRGGTITTGTWFSPVRAAGADWDGNLWIAVNSHADIHNDPELQEKYAACEAQHPDFAQPIAEFVESPEEIEQREKATEAGLEFAKCGRENGFTWVSDPLPTGQIPLTDNISEPDLIALLDTCANPEKPLKWDATCTNPETCDHVFRLFDLVMEKIG